MTLDICAYKSSYLPFICNILHLGFCHLQPKGSYPVQAASESPGALLKLLCGAERGSAAAIALSEMLFLLWLKLSGYFQVVSDVQHTAASEKRLPARSQQPELS